MIEELNFKRPAYGEPAMIVVPKAGTFLASTLAEGSAAVAFLHASGMLVTYYEGNIYGASNLRRFEDRAAVAYGRLTQRAPTVALALVPLSDCIVVGCMTPDAVTITQHQVIDQWLKGLPA